MSGQSPAVIAAFCQFQLQRIAALYSRKFREIPIAKTREHVFIWLFVFHLFENVNRNCMHQA
ncbi:MAG TPA: hypothetical protein VKA34_21445 [Balneolales bacterium]|nr:hypothetical protein [Balneolales bacterium]